MAWYGRGRSSVKGERIEMRRAGTKQVKAAQKSAFAAIERRSLETQEQIMVGGLITEDARQFLEGMPTAESLMPALAMDKAESLMIEDKGKSPRYH